MISTPDVRQCIKYVFRWIGQLNKSEDWKNGVHLYIHIHPFIMYNSKFKMDQLWAIVSILIWWEEKNNDRK